jgi:hypothetical protein
VLVDFLVNMSASADVLAMAKVEVDLSTIPEGKNVSTGSERLLNGSLSILTGHRSLSNGVASQSSSATEPQTRSRKPRTSKSRHCEIPKGMKTVLRSQNG